MGACMTYIRGQRPTDPCLETVPQSWKQSLAEPCRENKHEHLSPGLYCAGGLAHNSEHKRIDVHPQGHSLTHT